jgi:hypothetical protein
MVTYLLYAWPTVLLSVVLGLTLGWLTWARGRRSALDAERDALRRLAYQRDRDLVDRDSTIAILREELAAEAAEAARLRRLLDDAAEAGRPAAAPSRTPGANGRAEPSPSVFAVAARRVTTDADGLTPAGEPVAGTGPRRPVAES